MSGPSRAAGFVEASTPRKKIAFFRQGLFSYSNVRTAEQLRARFPEYDVEEIDVLRDVMRGHPIARAIAFAHTVRLYGRRLVAQRFPITLAALRTPYLFRELRRLIRQEYEPRAAEFAFTFQTQSLFDASLPGVPHFVYTDHTHLANMRYPAFKPEDLFPSTWTEVEREIYENARHIFVMSDHVRDSLNEQYGIERARVSTVFAGSNVDVYPVPLDNDQFRNQTILFVGLEWERKGGPTLVAAFEQLRHELPAAELIIAGCRPSLNKPHIRVIGRIGHTEIKNWLSKSAVLCLPTRIEPFGIAVVEAFWHRIPVVVSNIGAMPSLVADGETGRLVPPDDPRALRDALLELLRDPAKCRRFGEAGYERARRDFSWDAVGGKIRAGIDAALGYEQGAGASRPRR